jgi:hypothetical protein
MTPAPFPMIRRNRRPHIDPDYRHKAPVPVPQASEETGALEGAGLPSGIAKIPDPVLVPPAPPAPLEPQPAPAAPPVERTAAPVVSVVNDTSKLQALIKENPQIVLGALNQNPLPATGAPVLVKLPEPPPAPIGKKTPAPGVKAPAPLPLPKAAPKSAKSEKAKTNGTRPAKPKKIRQS